MDPANIIPDSFSLLKDFPIVHEDVVTLCYLLVKCVFYWQSHSSYIFCLHIVSCVCILDPVNKLHSMLKDCYFDCVSCGQS